MSKEIMTFGGTRLKSNPKTKRPLCTKRAIHIVLKSKWATGTYSMLQHYNCKKIDTLIREHAKACSIRIYNIVNVGNHIHIVIKLDDKNSYSKFIRVISGLIARHVLRRERGEAQEDGHHKRKLKKIKFWLARPFTRILTWGRDYNHIHQYMIKNQNDAKRSMTAWGFDIVDVNLILQLNTKFNSG